jgi:hypothetical protein
MNIRKSQALRRLAVLILVLGTQEIVPAARADIIVFTNEAAFLRAAPIVSTEKFDEFASGTLLGQMGTVRIDGVTYTAAADAQWSADRFFGPAPSPPNVLFQRNTGTRNGSATLTFGDGQSTEAIGFFVTSPLLSPRSFYQLTVTTTDGGQLVEPIDLNSDTPVYRGFVASEGISSVRIDPLTVEGARPNFGLDNVSRAAIVGPLPVVIPEPASFTLFGLGGLVLLGCRQRPAPRTSRCLRRP